MFTSHFREATQHEIRIPEETMDFATLRIICEFIYTGVAQGVTRANAVDVLVVSEMYGLNELKQFCERFLWYYVDADNAAQLYRTASTHRAPQLARVCEDFIVRNMERVTQSAAFVGMAKEEKEEIERLAKDNNKRKEVRGEEGRTEVREEEGRREVDSQGNHAVAVEVADGVEV